jgi:ribonuclease E
VEKLLLINADEPEEVRVALVEDGRLEELYVETAVDPTAKGNVYAGRVQNVEKGIGAAFVDLGSGRTGFLHVSDVADPSEPVARAAPPPAPAGEVGGEPAPLDAAALEPVRGPPRRIQDVVQPGDELLVQVSRGPVGQKGPALTTRISLPGRYVVLLANSTRSGVSRRIERSSDRDRARSLAADLQVPDGMGTILRTASLHRTREELEADLAALLRLYGTMQERLAEGGGPRLVHAESDLAARAVRDVLPPDVARIVVDDEETAARVVEALAAAAPPRPAAVEAAGTAPTEGDGAGGAPGAGPTPAEPSAPAVPVVERHPGPQPLFHAYQVEAQVEEAFRRTVRLPSGGSIVIDPTEALVAIDVNSGRLTEEEDLEATALKTDLEAAVAVARHLRLRDLGGVIVVDFIDLRDPEHVHEVEVAFGAALKRDRARMRVGRIGPFGCLEMTRQRIRPALESVTHVPCSACGGTGRRRHAVGLSLRVLREMRARVARTRGQGGMEVRVEPAVADVLKGRKARAIRAVEAALTGPVRVVAEAQMAHGNWSIRGLPARSAAPESA